MELLGINLFIQVPI